MIDDRFSRARRPMSHRRVIVVGAGPVGLVAAACLAAENIPVTVIEAEQGIPNDLRASTFHPPTLEFLDRLDVAGPCVAQGLICPNWQFRDRRQGVIATFDLNVLAGDTRFPYRLQCEQWKLTRLLRDRLAASGRTEFIYAARAVGLHQTADDVTVTVEHPDGAQAEFSASFVIGADGGRSAIRKALGVAFDGLTIPEIFLSLSTAFPYDEAIPDLAAIAYISDPDEWLVLLRTPSLWRVLLPTDPGEREEAILAPARVEARLQAVVPSAKPYEVVHKTAYRVHERIADHYVSGRVLLAGDAAHLNNPLGGMGLNGGIHDAINLAEKLVQVWRGGDPGLLGRYERQRRKVAVETVQAQALRNRAILNERDPARRQAYYDDLGATAADPQRARAYLLRSSMIQSLRDVASVA
jgi:3-(3-hydroxy-phenyl)propionate hydroxylase